MKKRGARRGEPDCVVVTPHVLRGLSVPRPGDADDKEARGRVLVVGGSRETPGAVVLAGLAALRAGAGKLRVATVESLAPHAAVSLPEARVYSLPETKGGDIRPSSSDKIMELIDGVDAACVGPGMIDERAAGRLMKALLSRPVRVPLVLDANALACLSEDPALLHGLKGRVVVTPQAEEMSRLLGVARKEVEGRPLETARRAAAELRAVVALKGHETFVVGPDGARCYRNRAGNVGLATSGSGDVLAGLIAGLAARGADALAAAVWGVHAHALAGDRVAKSVGRLGYLARELLAELPSVFERLEASY